MSALSGPEKIMMILIDYIKEKFSEHYHTKIKINIGLPEGEASKENVLFLLPLQVIENSNLTKIEKTRYQEKNETGELEEYQKNPVLYFDLRILMGFEAKPDMKKTLLLMQLKQIFKEYGQIKADTEVIGLKELPEWPMKDQLRLWNNLGMQFRPTMISRITVSMEPIRTWRYKKVLEKIIHSNTKK